MVFVTEYILYTLLIFQLAREIEVIVINLYANATLLANVY